MNASLFAASRGVAAVLGVAIALGCGSKPADIRVTPAKLTF